VRVSDEHGAIAQRHDGAFGEPEGEELAVLVEDAVGAKTSDDGAGDLVDLLGRETSAADVVGLQRSGFELGCQRLVIGLAIVNNVLYFQAYKERAWRLDRERFGRGDQELVTATSIRSQVVEVTLRIERPVDKSVSPLSARRCDEADTMFLG
jgi:hypothetical protein